MSSFCLIIANQRFSKEDILSWNGADADAYTRDVIGLCKDWFDGKEQFELKTSGSTGTPKTISIHRSQIEASATATLTFFNLNIGDVVLCPLSVDVIGGQMMLYRSIIGQLELHVIQPSKSLAQIDTSIAYRFMPIAGLQLFEILTQHPDKIAVLNKLDHLLIGGSAISDTLQSHIKNRLTCKVWHSYGMTETVSHIAMRGLHPQLEAAYTVFDGIEIAHDNRACLQIKGAVTSNEWIQTNDIIEQINSNQFHFIGRIDFVINSGGIKIPIEAIEKIVEPILTELQLSNPFIICGIPDDALGEKIVLLIDTTSDLTNKQITTIENQLRLLLTKYQIPKRIDSCSFIYTSSGKINRQKTVEAYHKKGLVE